MRNNSIEVWDLVKETDCPETLRGYLLEVEAEIKSIVGEDPLDFYLNQPYREDIDRIHDLLGDRKYILDRMFTFSEDEVRRIEKVNALLTDLRKQMFQRTCNLYRCYAKHGVDSAFDDDVEVEAKLKVEVCYEIDSDHGTVLHLENDEYYGSDFAYMLYVMQLNNEEYRFTYDYIDNCFITTWDNKNADMCDKELGCDYTDLDDGTSWDECLREDCLKHICFTHAFHDMFTHHDYTLADIIRINYYTIDVNLDCQRIFDQERRRFQEINSEK